MANRKKKKLPVRRRPQRFPPYAQHPAVLARTKYPHETKYPWLSLVLDADAIFDYETQLAITEQIQARGQNIACHEGCSDCCVHQEVRVTLLEFMAISWFYCEICSADLRGRIRSQLISYNERTACPFLIENACSIRPVRPLVCRGFFVYGQPCAPNEDVSKTRPHDIHPPDIVLGQYIAFRLLDYPDFGCPTVAAKEKALRNGIMAAISKPMHMWDWADYVKLSDEPCG